MKNILVAVYGSLRKNMGNHRLLGDSEFLGEFNTSPEYTLISLGAFPGLKKEGNTSVKMEVYKVSQETDKKLEYLEGYYSPGHSNNFYEKEKIETPYGEAFVYIYNPSIRNRTVVESGDWTAFKNQQLSPAKFGQE